MISLYPGCGLAMIKGAAFGPGRSCPAMLPLAELRNNANPPAMPSILLADLLVNGSVVMSFYDDGLCVLESIGSKSTQSHRLCNLIWTGGDEVVLSRLVLSWETARGTGCSQASRKCSNRNTKCYAREEVAVQLPLTVSFSMHFGNCTYHFYDHSLGGTGAYRYYWDFGDGSHSEEVNPLHVFEGAGIYTVTLQVSDQSGAVSTCMRDISFEGCPCSISGPVQACLERLRPTGQTLQACHQDGFAGSLME